MKRHSEFTLTRVDGRAKGGRFLVLSHLASDSLPHSKFGIIVTKKIGNAVTRNLLKRRIHHIVAKHYDELQGSHYIVTILRWRAPEATFAELEADWLKQASRLGILDKPKVHSS